MNSSKSSGFTLIEFLISVAIIGLLTSIIIVAINPLGKIQQGRDSNRIAAMKQTQTALESYYTKYSRYPDMTEPYTLGGSTWERSECNASSCVGTPAPFMEYLTPEFFDNTFADPLRDSLSVADRPAFGFLYQPDTSSGNQGYCMITQLETKNHVLKIDDHECDDGFDNEADNDPSTSKYYAIGSVKAD
ncbi:type II secretion system protein [candidate division WWE3 bacterium]|uniref:Type II secretion system protein n=1 Tax=candidate division WWE3 bacterium TaxID=2053526 RepID=A0A955LWE3_UNCKA|nr:type II secretion system protein [candidate division WWE3 bacterium]